MYRHNLRIAASILICFLIKIQGADKYTDENRPYEFGFEVNVEGTKQQHRHEEKDKDGIIKGEFGFITADDVYHVTVYATDKDGHFKILSMKNIHLKPSGGVSSSARQGHSLNIPVSTRAPATSAPRAPATSAPPAPQIASRFQTETNAAPPRTNAPSQPQTLFTPVPAPSPVRSCSSCSIPTTPRAPPLAPPISNSIGNQQSYPVSPNPLLNNLQTNGVSKPFSSNLEPPHQHGTQGVPISGNVQNYPSQPSQSPYAPRGPSQSAGVQLNAYQQPSQSSSQQQVPSAPNTAGAISQPPSQSSYPSQSPLVPAFAPNPQQVSQSSYPVQGPSVPASNQPNFQQTGEPSYPIDGPPSSNQAAYPIGGLTGSAVPQLQQPGQSSYPSKESSNSNNIEPQQLNLSSYPVIQQTGQSPYPIERSPPSSQAAYPVGGLSGGVGPQVQQPGQSSYPNQVESQQPNLSSYPIQSNAEQQGGAGERTSKQYNSPNQRFNSNAVPNEYPAPGPSSPKKPKLVSVNMQIVDKNTDIHALQPGEEEGLPAGLSEHDMSRLLYTFNYTVGFHGHFEEGYADGVKKGYYYVTGRNGVKTRVDYVADATGFHPKMSQEVLDLLSDDVPKPETEKDAKYGLKSYEFKWLYFPVDS